MTDHSHKWVRLDPIDSHIQITLEGRGKSFFIINQICEQPDCFMGRTEDGVEFDIRQGVELREGMKRITSGLLRNSKESRE